MRLAHIPFPAQDHVSKPRGELCESDNLNRKFNNIDNKKDNNNNKKSNNINRNNNNNNKPKNV